MIIGTDGNGFDHHFIKSKNAIVVINPSGRRVDRIEQISTKPWIEAIEDREGWKRREVYADFADIIENNFSEME